MQKVKVQFQSTNIIDVEVDFYKRRRNSVQSFTVKDFKQTFYKDDFSLLVKNVLSLIKDDFFGSILSRFQRRQSPHLSSKFLSFKFNFLTDYLSKWFILCFTVKNGLQSYFKLQVIFYFPFLIVFCTLPIFKTTLVRRSGFSMLHNIYFTVVSW